MQVLEIALEIHGNLAPSSVQPLHKMMLERFNLFRESLNCWGKARRQKSDSIINMPLPPLPVSTSNYDHDETYSQIRSFDGYGSNRKSLELADISSYVAQAPPRPSKSEYINSPEIPPKLGSAPPLPPRFTPDKRVLNSELFDSTEPPAFPRRGHNIPYSIIDISLESELECDEESDNILHRDSGISTNSQAEAKHKAYSSSTNSLPMIGYVRCHQKTSSNPEEMFRSQICQLKLKDLDLENLKAPPALPPKGFASSKSYDDDDESSTNFSSDSTSESLPLPPIPPIQQHFAENKTVTCQAVPCCGVNSSEFPCCVPEAVNLAEDDCEECFCDNPPLKSY